MALQLLGAAPGSTNDAITLSYADGKYAPLASPNLTGTTTVSLLKITGGVPGAGKVLTSDASGNASWATAPVTTVAGRTGAVVIGQSDVTGLTASLAAKADLDGGGKIPQAQIPAIALTEHLGVVASQAAMLALTGQRGDWCTRSDKGTDWQLIAEPSSSLSSWREHTYPTSPVQSVAGRTGAITLSVGDVTGAAPIYAPAFTGPIQTPGITVTSSPGAGRVLTSDAFGVGTWVDPAVKSVAGKTGVVTLSSGDIPGLDLAMSLKADLLGGKVPGGQLPLATETEVGGLKSAGPAMSGVEELADICAVGHYTDGSGRVTPKGLPMLFGAFLKWNEMFVQESDGNNYVIRDRLDQSTRDSLTRADVALTPVNPTVSSGTLTTPALKVTGGTIAAGKVLTSDAAGVATWQTPAAPPVTSVASKTGAVTLVKGDVGLGSVDNTADLAKPVSTATQTALNGKANVSGTATGLWTGLEANLPAVGTAGVLYAVI